MATQSESSTIVVQEVATESIVLALLGTRPLILNRMAVKAQHELLLPGGRKTIAQKQASLKHAPLDEYRASAYRLTEGPALLGMMATAIKGAMMTAALDLPGTRKAQIGRLVWVEGDYVPVYGIPKLFMAVPRSADMNRTPDIRTRAIVPEWAALVTVTYVVPILTRTSIVNLLVAGGMTAGIGDWRQEKGKGNYGQFTVVSPDDARVVALCARGGRAAQEAAMESPEAYNQETADMLTWYGAEVQRRGK